MLSVHQVNLVLDVGANTGQFGNMLRSAGYRGGIVSFEPSTGARSRLLRASKSDPDWNVADQMAIGDQEGEVQLHIAGNSVSSSVLPMLDSHVAAAPKSVYVGSETVVVRTLDAASVQYVRSDAVPFLKIDTQGYEDKVLRGAPNLLRRTIGLQIELSFIPLYEGQRHFDEVIAELKGLGFELWDIAPAFIHPKSGRLLQVDATFFRTSRKTISPS